MLQWHLESPNVNLNHNSAMKVICSYCEKEMKEAAPYDDSTTTKGICQTCAQEIKRKINNPDINEYLERFNLPVLLVDEDARVLAANSTAKKKLDFPMDDLTGHLAGDVMECANARKKEGCGRTAHCLACSLRNTITAVSKTGNSNLHVSAVLSQDEKDIEMVISAERLDSHVQVTLEKIQ